MLRRKLTAAHAAVIIAAIALLVGGALVLSERTVKQARLHQTQQRYADRVSRGEIPPAAPGQNDD